MSIKIQVTHLSKYYKNYPNPRARFYEWLSLGRKQYHQVNCALYDINFQVETGEALGIVGMNGAGKTTLLKLITGNTFPTSGHIKVQGRVGALLELGVGFHPEFTGRQNVMIAGQLLGLSYQEITALMPEIEAFAEIGHFIDKPFRIYSTGMKMRLGFSLGTAVKPDVMIVDEALSVGDQYFQHKCYRKLKQLRKEGTALLLVSHDSKLITAICDKAILLHDHTIAMSGSSEHVMNYYIAMLADIRKHSIQLFPQHNGKIQTISGTKEAVVADLALYNEKNEKVSVLNVGEKVRLSMTVLAYAHLEQLTIGYEIKDLYGQAVFGTNSYHLNHQINNIKAGESVTLHFKFEANLGVGQYSISVALHQAETHLEKNYEWRDLALFFSISNQDKRKFIGSAWLPTEIESIRMT